MNKMIALDAAISKIKSGDTLLVGGFLTVGGPNRILDALADTAMNSFTLICNDTGYEHIGVGKLIAGKKIKRVLASHIGTNPETGRQMNESETDVVLVPQGTLAEQIRAGGYGLGGILTPTGLGTEVEVGKEIITVDNQDYLLEKPLSGDVALLYANTADQYGNLKFHGANQNFNRIMAPAATLTIVEVDEVVDCLDPNTVHVPGIFVDYIVCGGTKQ